MAPTVIGGMSLATVEAYSKWSNVLQLAVGIMSMLAYVTILVVQTRFFPIQVFTQGGNQIVKFEPQLYQTLQVVQGSMSLLSALLFLGRDSFCVSKRIMVNNRPAHQVCYDWAYGMRLSILLSVSSAAVSMAGLVMSIFELLDASRYSCVDVQPFEFLCDGTLDMDALQLGIQGNLLRSSLTIPCLDQQVRLYVPLIYVIIYAVTIVLGALGAHSAFFTYRFYMDID